MNAIEDTSAFFAWDYSRVIKQVWQFKLFGN